MTRHYHELLEKECEHCKTLFRPLSERAKYCTSNCQINAARARKRIRDKAFREGRTIATSSETLESFDAFLERQAKETGSNG